MSEESNTTLSNDELADKRIMRQLSICIAVMVAIAAAIVTVANTIA